MTGDPEESNERLHVQMTSTPYMTTGARKAAHRLGWALIVLFIITFAIGTANLLYTTRQVSIEQQRLKSACEFYADLAGLPVTAPAPARKPTLLAVETVAHSRQAARGLGCEHIPPPAPSFARWARVYGLPSN